MAGIFYLVVLLMKYLILIEKSDINYNIRFTSEVYFGRDRTGKDRQ